MAFQYGLEKFLMEKIEKSEKLFFPICVRVSADQLKILEQLSQGRPLGKFIREEFVQPSLDNYAVGQESRRVLKKLNGEA